MTKDAMTAPPKRHKLKGATAMRDLVARLFGRPPTEEEIREYEIRKNLASLKAVPEHVLTGTARAELVRRASQGEDTYAYRPACATPDEWNIWTDKARYSAEEWNATFASRLA